MVATDFVGVAAYKLRWPADLFVKEVRLLLDRSDESARTDDWKSEVVTLLGQAFTSEIPSEDFTSVSWVSVPRDTPVVERPGVRWLQELADTADSQPIGPKPYTSQSGPVVVNEPESSLPAIVDRVRSLLQELHRDNYFAQALGYESVEIPTDRIEKEFGNLLDYRLSWTAPSTSYSEFQLYDIIEVFHDLAVRPTRIYTYSHGGYVIQAYSGPSGQALYRWRMNQLLDTTTLSYRIAETGPDTGRVVAKAPDELNELISEVVAEGAPKRDETSEAIALFRDRNATRSQRRSAIVTLAGILEERRNLLKKHLFSKDDGALFRIANEFDLRHQRADQRSDYDEAFLEWVFYWYLATIQLSDRLPNETQD